MMGSANRANLQRAVLAGVGVIVMGLDGCASEPPPLRPSTAMDFERRDRAFEDIADLHDHPWAGEYGTGRNFVGSYLLLSPSEGAIWGTFSCSRGSAYYLGPIEGISERVVLIREIEPGSSAVAHFGRRLVRFTWGERRYVAWPNQLVRAEARLDEGRNPAWAPEFFMVHQEDKDKAPGTPEEFVQIIRDACGPGGIAADR